MSVAGVRRLEPLTGIRIFAALAVFMSHLPTWPGAPEIVSSFMRSGYCGVTLFFILSGFILAWNYEGLLGSRITRPGLRTFYVARIARIYPLYLAALALVILPSVDSARDIVENFVSPVFWTHFFALQAWTPATAFSYNPPAWSIGVELFLYALFPFILLATRALRRSQRGLVTLAVAAVALSFALAIAFTVSPLDLLPSEDPNSSHRWLYLLPLTRLLDFMVGIALAGIVRKGGDGKDHVRWGRWAQVGGIVAACAAMATPALVESAISWDALYIVPFAALILGLGVAPSTAFAKILSSRAIVFLGESSFAFYLFHVIIILWLAPLVGTSTTSWASGSSAVLAICLAVGVGAHVAIERPARSGIRRLFDSRRGSNLTLSLPMDDSEPAPADV